MASQVKPNTKPTPYADRPLPPSADLETPDDYKNTFKVGTLSAGVSGRDIS
jgi:cytochrome c oxidase assembly protein subunit 23